MPTLKPEPPRPTDEFHNYPPQSEATGIRREPDTIESVAIIQTAETLRANALSYDDASTLPEQAKRAQAWKAYRAYVREINRDRTALHWTTDHYEWRTPAQSTLPYDPSLTPDKAMHFINTYTRKRLCAGVPEAASPPKPKDIHLTDTNALPDPNPGYFQRLRDNPLMCPRCVTIYLHQHRYAPLPG